MSETFQQDIDSVTGDRRRESLSLYVHLPFCRTKCTYCAFPISTDGRLEERYVSALVQEMRRRIPAGTGILSLYFGGGTPSRLSRSAVEVIGEELSQWILGSGAEVTLEANPEDVDESHLDLWVESLGVNRLSIGVQSFHDSELAPLGRGHGRSGAEAAIALAARKVPRLSVDLILGLPDQTVESVESNAELAMTGPAGHLSLYLLDLEPGSALERRVQSGLVDLPPDDATAEMYETVIGLAKANGFEQYEVSNFARPGQESVHNLRYWSREPYTGVGLGAHSFDGAVRSANTRSIREYVEMIESGSLPETFRETLSDEDVRHEKIFLGLRQARGMEADRFRNLAGDRAEEWLQDSIDQGWVTLEGGFVRFTVDGFLVSDELMSELF